ncbi:MAG TPA: U32 family peptidase [Candidatus Mediterraneibacter merdipullorum]|nr:U32 family peptidase [Candidatus Mediterraneibacter merdipullorum]
MTDRKTEILSPAGSYAAFAAALRAGADAVYAGGPRFGARAYAENFTEEELVRAVEEAHLFGRRFYLTVNTLLKDSETEELFDYLAPLYACGLDAVIVQDLGVAAYIRRCFPGLDIHASTQMTITDAPGAKFAEAQGMTRVVPARELSLAEIRRIRSQTDMEIECFVHGALCFCYSGQCLLSSMIGGRSGNRGQCAQPCRLPGTFGGQTCYPMSPKDICTLALIPELVEAGIDSFKIEGRMKSPEYVAGVTLMYRKYTDLYLAKGREGFSVRPEDQEMLLDLYNRGGFSSGYYQMHNGREMMASDRPNHAGVPALQITGQRGREVTGRALTGLGAGDVLEVTGGKGNHTLGHPVRMGASVSFLVNRGVYLKKGRVLSRVRNESLLRHIREEVIGRKVQRPVRGILTMRTGSPASLEVVCADGPGRYCALSDETVQESLNQPLTPGQAEEKLRRTGNSEFCFSEVKILADDNIFFPVRKLNELRRMAFEGLREDILSAYRRSPASGQDIPVPAGSGRCASADAPGHTPSDSGQSVSARTVCAAAPGFSISVETKEQLVRLAGCLEKDRDRVERVYFSSDLLLTGDRDVRSVIGDIREMGLEVMPALPYISRSGDDLRDILYPDGASGGDRVPFDGVLLRNLGQVRLLEEYGFDKKKILDHNLYVFNRYAKSFWKDYGITGYTAPAELNARELERLGLDGAELLVYGRVPLMVSAQCMQKNTGRCRKTPKVDILTDRKGHAFPVKNVCRHCYNLIYNDRPLCLVQEKDAVFRLSPERLRISFTVEEPGGIPDILDTVKRGFTPEEEAVTPGFEYTQGHFRRGVL